MTTIEPIATPAVVIDDQIALKNVRKLANYAARHRLNVRPHTKTHKSIRMAKAQLSAGAVGLTVAKVGEAEVMIQAGDDLLIAYSALDPARTGRIAQLAKGHTIRLAVDSALAAEALGAAARSAGVTLGILIDVDTGFHRTGVQSPEAALALAQLVDRTAGLRLDGLLTFPGHLRGPGGVETGEFPLVQQGLSDSIGLLKQHGLATTIVSGGSTPSAYHSHLVSAYTEIRPGTYIYNDMNTVYAQACTLDEVAVKVVCTVISDAVPDKVVLDAGTKTLTSDRNGPRPDSGHGYVMQYPDAKIVRLSEEHGEVDVSQCTKRPKLGDRVEVIPNHVCPCINLHDAVWLRDNGELQRLPVDARGKIS
ncbi:MAG TPA: alanine racemase [Tepidisphaeraceae bacterium]|nr:alanine racemase [Tepidisphaeraceae bacterium]